MQVKKVVELVAAGNAPHDDHWIAAKDNVIAGIKRMVWPHGSGQFSIYPVKQANGVVPIKSGLMTLLLDSGWRLEQPLDLRATRRRPGSLDAVKATSSGVVAVEWETGNISSSHRALNKMALGLLDGVLLGGILILPTRAFYRFLTDRVGNFDELEPYFPVWQALPIERGMLLVVAVEHDAEDVNAPRLSKGTDGRALR